MKYFVVTDVHGYYELLCDTLAEAGFSATAEDHKLVVLGDLMDRGSQPTRCRSIC